MAKKQTRMPAVNRVQAGQKAFVELPCKGPTYYKLMFNCTGTGLDVTDIERIDILINGNVRMTYENLQELIDINSFYGRSADTFNQWMIHFFHKEYQELAYKRAGGIGTADVDTLVVEIKLAAAAPADITITCEADYDTVPQPIGIFYGVREYSKQSNAVGVVEMNELPRGKVYTAMHFFKADINYIELTVDDIKVVDATKSTIERFQKDANIPRVPVTARATHLDFILDGDGGDVLNTANVRDMRLKLTFGSIGTCKIKTETLESL